MNYIENPFDCPVTRTMSLIGGKWKPIILNILGMGTIRFGKLNHMIPAISNKMLSSELKQLEELGIYTIGDLYLRIECCPVVLKHELLRMNALKKRNKNGGYFS